MLLLLLLLHLQLAENGQAVYFWRQEALVDHGHFVVAEAEYAVVDVELGELALVYAQVVFALHE